MGSLIPDSLVQAHLGSKRRNSDLEDGVDEPASKRSRSAGATDEKEHGGESFETIATADAQAPEPNPTGRLTHDGQGSTSSVPNVPDPLGNGADEAITDKSAAPELIPEKSIDNVVGTEPPKAGPPDQPTRTSQDSAPAISNPAAAALGDGVEASVDNASNSPEGLVSKIDPAASITSLQAGVEDAKPAWAVQLEEAVSRPVDYQWVNDTECGEMIQEFWAELRSLPSRFVANTFPPVYSWDRLPGECQDEISKWATNASDHFNSSNEDNVHDIFAAWIHHILYEHVFSGADPDKWNGELWQSFGKIQASAQELVTDSDDKFNPLYHHWRNLTARVIHRQNPGKRHIDARWLRSQIEKRFLSIQTEYLEASPRSGNQSVHDVLDSNYKALINGVMHMDMLMTVTRRHIKMEMFHPDTAQVNGFCPEEDRMEIKVTELGAEPGLVDYIMVPAFTVHGKIKGGYKFQGTKSAIYPLGCSYDFYDSSCSTPMVVVCPEKLEERGQN
ncbi:unnamed protein product [Clonostachys rosea]|uniref:Uncharacterized protein n=1 Tax=Bionectria ochroleuca TaxID=29856 RepID=A0ABY6U898_BIOOC|nr:unnamed protein product [Clonostachys rosea]